MVNAILAPEPIAFAMANICGFVLITAPTVKALIMVIPVKTKPIIAKKLAHFAI